MQVPQRFNETLQAKLTETMPQQASQTYVEADPEGMGTGLQWLLEDTICELAPMLLSDTFKAVHSDFVAEHAQSGTTATVAFVCGHEMIVATVGDSLAYIDTGAQVRSTLSWMLASTSTRHTKT